MAEPPATASSAAATAAPDALLATKLHVPRTRPGFVVRPRLVDQLAQAHEGELVLVCAPAGFGKTALLAHWARRDPRPVAWLSLDDADNDPARFWRHATAALDRVRPVDAERVAALLQGLQPTSFEAVVTTLVNELAGVTEEVVLVLDDYHLIQAPPVHASVGFLLEHLPASLRLVLASRADPPLPLSRLRARGQLAELRAAELRFTTQEAAALLRTAVGAELPEAAVAALGERTEGWVAGLQLAALSLQGRTDVAAFVEGFSGSHRYVLDYLAEEVLDASLITWSGFCWRRRCWSGCRGRCVPRLPAGPTARRCWSRWNGPTCSWFRWTRCAAGGATTSCSPTCCAPASRGSSPSGCPSSTQARPPGPSSTGWSTTPSGMPWPPATPPGRLG
jgi:LuxR family maltose regulon positive regulatory protein